MPVRLSGLRVRHGVVAVAFLLVLSLPFALRPEREEPTAAGGSHLPARELVIVSPHAESIRREFEWAFSDWAAETQGFRVKIQWLDVGGTLQAIRYVADQFEQTPGGIGIDIFFGGGVDPFMHLGGKGLLHRCSLPEEVLEPIPQTYAGMEVYARDRSWFGACLAGFGILYNKDVLQFLDTAEPATWEDLGAAGYFTWVSSADPRQSGSMHMVYEIILQAYGWEEGWETVMRIGANCRGFSRQASDVPREVATGEAACGMAIDTYALRAVAEVGEDRMGFRLPDHLTVVNPDGIGVLKGAPNVEVAELFVQFVLSEEGQKLWILRRGAPGGPKEFQLYRLPVLPGLARRCGEDAVVTFDPFEFEGGVAFDPEKKNVRWQILNDLIGARIIDTRQELAEAWRHLRKLPDGHHRKAELLKPPVPEQQLLELAESKWDDPYFRAETVARWSREARALYRRLKEGL
ncbi:MAG: ABC transporter substrate-binding protein [Candidatus Brocadiaceae bacterium]|jgi:ABC-type Fe3+ transport system substrate-binding protein